MPVGEDKKPFLKAKIQIGNSKGPVSYVLKQTVFHHDDVPHERRQRKSEVQQWAKSTLLSVDRKGWNQSVDAGTPICERRQAENFRRDRSKPFQYNYRAETLDSMRLTAPIDMPTKFHISQQLEEQAQTIKELRDSDRIQRGYFQRTGEMPIHPSLTSDLEPWHMSTETGGPVALQSRLQEKTEKARVWTAKVNSRLDGVHKKYVNPMQDTINFQKEVRRQKAANIFTLEKHLHRCIMYFLITRICTLTLV